MLTESSITTQNIDEIIKPTGDLYESIAVVAKRSRQVASNLKKNLDNKIAEFATTVDNLEDVFENVEQIEISKFYERLPKPTITAMKEFIDGKLIYRKRDETEEEDVT